MFKIYKNLQNTGHLALFIAFLSALQCPANAKETSSLKDGRAQTAFEMQQSKLRHILKRLDTPEKIQALSPQELEEVEHAIGEIRGDLKKLTQQF